MVVARDMRSQAVHATVENAKLHLEIPKERSNAVFAPPRATFGPFDRNPVAAPNVIERELFETGPLAEKLRMKSFVVLLPVLRSASIEAVPHGSSSAWDRGPQ